MDFLTRKSFIKSSSWLLPLPLLNASYSNPKEENLKRLVIVGNPLGMHPESFFPIDYGKNYTTSRELKIFDWLRDRLTVFSHTDHGMEPGHTKEVSFLSGVLPRDSDKYPDGCASLDQILGEQFKAQTRYPVINVAVGEGIRESWTRNGTPIIPINGARKLYYKIFLNLSETEKLNQLKQWSLKKRMLSSLNQQLKTVSQYVGKNDLERLEQYRESIHGLSNEIKSQEKWINKEKPKYKFNKGLDNLNSEYENIFDMLAIALQTNQTRVATVSFSRNMDTKFLGLSKSYHSYTHNGKIPEAVEGLIAIENFQLKQLSRFLEKLDSIDEPKSNGSMLDHTLVMFGSGMGYGGTHSNRNLPIVLFGGGLKHQGHVSLKKNNGNNTPLCNLYLSILQKFGVERDVFSISNGSIII